MATDSTPAQLTVTTTVVPRGPAGALILTDAQVEQLGGGKRAPLQVSIGDRTVRLRLAVMGGENMIGLSKANRSALAVDIGDTVTAVITVDEAPREVELPAELATALAAHPEARAAYEKLAFTHRKEYATWVAEAKRPETRERRVTQTIERLLGTGTAGA
jgi:hypothetical protein